MEAELRHRLEMVETMEGMVGLDRIRGITDDVKVGGLENTEVHPGLE